MTEPTLLAGAIPTTATYDPPSKYKGRKNAKGQLVGTRIDPATPLGAELAKLRMMWVAAAEANKRIAKDDPDLARRMSEISQNVPVNPDLHALRQWRDQRRMVIRARISQVIDTTVAVHGRPPTTIGIPAETLDEVREACCDYDVTFVLEG
jgi:hypothetical protein